jgi:hypothetical protein
VPDLGNTLAARPRRRRDGSRRRVPRSAS